MISNNHSANVRIWDGTRFHMVEPQAADELEAAGTHQKAQNLQSKDLLTKKQLRQRSKEIRAQQTPASPPKKQDPPADSDKESKEATPEPSKGSYATKVMKGE